MKSPAALSEQTIAAIRAYARKVTARGPIPGDEQCRIVGPLLAPGDDAQPRQRDTDAA